MSLEIAVVLALAIAFAGSYVLRTFWEKTKRRAHLDRRDG